MLSYGALSERQAVEYLMKNGFSILYQNFQFYGKGRGRKGELDIIASKNNVIHIIEVKARKNKRFGHPLSQITTHKVNSIKRATNFFLLKNKNHKDKLVQFDVITVYQGKINYYPRAF